MKVLLISRDYTTSNIIKNAFNNIGVDLKICLISKGEDIKAIAQKNEDIICMLDNLDIDNICYNIKNVEIKFNYIFTNDELLIDKIKIIANRINSKCVQDHISTSRNKLDFKKLIKKSQIKTPKFEVIYNKSDLNNLDIYLPCVVKPIDGFSSNGVEVVKDKKRLQKAINSVFVQNSLKSVLYGDQSEGCIIEEYIDGKEYSVDIIWNNSVAVDTIICSRIQNDLVHCPDYLYFIDPKIDKDLELLLIENAINIGKAYNIIHGSTHTEFKVKNNIAYVIDNAVRPGGGGIIYYMFDKFYKTNVLENFCKSMCEIKSTKTVIKNTNGKEYPFLMFYTNRKKGKFLKLDFDFSHPNLTITEIIKPTKRGDKIPDPKMMIIYMFYIFGYAKANSFQEFTNQIKLLDKEIKIQYY